MSIPWDEYEYELLPDPDRPPPGERLYIPNISDDGFVSIGGRLYSADGPLECDEYMMSLIGLVSIGERLYSAAGDCSDEDIRGSESFADAERHVWATQFLPVWEELDAESRDFVRELARVDVGWAVFNRALADAEARRDARIGRTPLIE